MMLAERVEEMTTAAVDDAEEILLEARVQRAADLIEPLWAKQGVVPVTGTTQTKRWEDNQIGRCAIGVLMAEFNGYKDAAERYCGMGLSDIAAGFDGCEGGLRGPSARVGAELRRRLQPVHAAKFRLGGGVVPS